jgi:CRISPR/Cas system-associated exonuclease Cas4 (RecB family)
MKTLKLSPSTISLFMECPRCFWLSFNRGIKRPATIFPSLPAGMDLVLKKHFDRHRLDRSLPEELDRKFEGRLFGDAEKLEAWRSGYKGLRYVDAKTGAILMGALDDLFVTSDGKYAPLDFKTRGSPRKDNTHCYYQHQMDIYSFLLEKNSLPAADFAILLFFHPTGVDERHNVIFDADPVKLPVDRARGEKLFLDAVACLAGPEPKPSNECGFCEWAEKLNDRQDAKAKCESKKERKNNLFDFA